MSCGTTIELACYSDRFAAETIKIRLAAAGIQSEVFGTDAASAFGMGGAPQRQMVRVEVASDDLQRAKDILEQDRRDAIERGSWVCNECSEENEPTFDLCWKCNSPSEPAKHPSAKKPRPEEVHGPIAIDVSPVNSAPLHDNPYRPVLVNRGMPGTQDRRSEAQSVPDPELVADVTRAFRSAIVGWLILPPLVSLYSIYRLLRLSSLVPSNRRLRRKVLATWLINLGSIAAWSAVWLPLIRAAIA